MKNRHKYTSWQNIRYMMKMLWKSDKGMVFYSMFKAISENIYYVFAVVYLAKYIYTCIARQTPFMELVKMIALMCIIHVCIHISSAGHQYYLKTHIPQVYRYIFGKVIDKSTRMEYKRFEQPDFYDKFTRALNESVSKGVEMLDVFAWFTANFIAAAMASVIIIEVDPVLMLFVIPSIISSLYFGSKAGNTYYELDFSNTYDGRTAAYVKRVFYEKKYASELRLFNISNNLIERHEKAYDGMYDRTKKLRKKVMRYESISWAVFILMSRIIPFIYVAVIVKTGENVDVAAYLAMVTSLEFVSGNISEFVEKLVVLNKQGLFINNLREFLECEPEYDGTHKQKVTGTLDDIEMMLYHKS